MCARCSQAQTCNISFEGKFFLRTFWEFRQIGSLIASQAQIASLRSQRWLRLVREFPLIPLFLLNWRVGWMKGWMVSFHPSIPASLRFVQGRFSNFADLFSAINRTNITLTLVDCYTRLDWETLAPTASRATWTPCFSKGLLRYQMVFYHCISVFIYQGQITLTLVDCYTRLDWETLAPTASRATWTSCFSEGWTRYQMLLNYCISVFIYQSQITSTL